MPHYRNRPMNIIWKPQYKQALFQARQEYEVLYGGAAGGGKSDALLTEALRQVDQPEYRALILRKTVPQLRELIDRSMALYPRCFPQAQYRAVEHVWIFPSGAKICFGSMHHENDRFQYQGRRFDYIAFDELTHFSSEEYFYMFSRNRPGAPHMRNYIRATANPGGIGHSWVKARFLDPAPPMQVIPSTLKIYDGQGREQILHRERIFIPSSVFDNTALMRNAPMYLSSLAMLPEAEKQALLYGNWNSFQGQVFGEFQDDPAHYGDGQHTHVIDPIPLAAHLSCYRVFDFGYSRPFAVGWFIVDEQGTAYMVKELYGMTDTPNEGLRIEPTEIARHIRETEQQSPILQGRPIIGIADPSIFDESRGESIAQMMEKPPHFIYFQRADNTRIAGKMQVHRRLRWNAQDRPSLYFFRCCTHMIRTLPQLVYSKSNIEDVDTTGEDHLYDVLRYFLMAKPLAGSAPQRRIRPREDPLELCGAFE